MRLSGRALRAFTQALERSSPSTTSPIGWGEHREPQRLCTGIVRVHFVRSINLRGHRQSAARRGTLNRSRSMHKHRGQGWRCDLAEGGGACQMRGDYCDRAAGAARSLQHQQPELDRLAGQRDRRLEQRPLVVLGQQVLVDQVADQLFEHGHEVLQQAAVPTNFAVRRAAGVGVPAAVPSICRVRSLYGDPHDELTRPCGRRLFPRSIGIRLKAVVLQGPVTGPSGPSSCGCRKGRTCHQIHCRRRTRGTDGRRMQRSQHAA
jgi:hypothetical protein